MVRTLSVMVCLLILAGVFGCAKKENVSVKDSSKLVYFRDTYEESRERFRARAGELARVYNNVEIASINASNMAGENLTIDSCFIPARKKRRKLIIISSGVHGIEGFAGSALQRMFMKELLPKLDLSETGVLLIHGINPYGFKHRRRVDEHNVDLNRNFDVDRRLFSTKNTGYPTLMKLLNPSEKLGFNSPGYVFFPVRAVYYIAKYGMGTLRESILKGQYEFPKGVYYGGREFSPRKAEIEKLIVKSATGSTHVFIMDLHTGYGARNRLHYFPNPITDTRNLAATKKVFEGYHVDWGDSADFYVTTGDFTDYIEKLFPGKTVIRMTAEYGTMDSQTTLGSIKSLKITIMENQAFHYGGKSYRDTVKVKKQFDEMYYPSSKEWRSEIMRQTAGQFPVLFGRFIGLK